MGVDPICRRFFVRTTYQEFNLNLRHFGSSGDLDTK